MMSKTVTSLFQSEQLATAAASNLRQAGIPEDAIDIWSTPHNLAPLLEDKGMSRSDAHAYVEGVIRGGSVVIVNCGDHHVDQVASILDHEGVLDLDGQQASWRSERGQEHAAAGLASEPTGSSSSAQATMAKGEDITGSPEMTQAKTDTAATSQPKEVGGRGRVRIHPRTVE